MIKNTDDTVSLAEAELFLESIRTIMTVTGLPFGPAVNVYIAERYPSVNVETELDRDSGVC